MSSEEKVIWRVGRKVGRNLYRGNEPIAMLATEDLAREIVAALNSIEALVAERDEAVRRADKAEEAVDRGWLYTSNGIAMCIHCRATAIDDCVPISNFPHAQDCIVREIQERKAGDKD